MKTARWRTVYVYIDCPTEGCGGGVEGTDGAFQLEAGTLPEFETFSGRPYSKCGECLTTFRVPQAALKALRG